jgi:hypothetical protein
LWTRGTRLAFLRDAAAPVAMKPTNNHVLKFVIAGIDPAPVVVTGFSRPIAKRPVQRGTGR